MSASSPTLGLALLVAVAGGAGAVLRALLIHHVGARRSDPLPLGTMLVNASGSLLLGILTGLSLYHGLGSHLLAVIGVGLCGGYTTWSTASWETVHLVLLAIVPCLVPYRAATLSEQAQFTVLVGGRPQKKTIR